MSALRCTDEKQRIELGIRKYTHESKCVCVYVCSASRGDTYASVYSTHNITSKIENCPTEIMNIFLNHYAALGSSTRTHMYARALLA